MGFTYNDDEHDSVSQIRGLLGDVTSPGHFSDETITARYSANQSNAYLAAATLAETWANQLTTQPAMVKAGGVEKQYPVTQMKDMRELAIRLRGLAGEPDGTWERVEATDWQLPRSPYRGY